LQTTAWTIVCPLADNDEPNVTNLLALKITTE